MAPGTLLHHMAAGLFPSSSPRRNHPASTPIASQQRMRGVLGSRPADQRGARRTACWRAPACTVQPPRRQQQQQQQQQQPRGNAALTPHSGYHFDGTGRRWFEGWYWRVTLPGDGQSFALIYSIDNPLGVQPLSGVGAQVMGPDDSYLIHYSKNVADFWADRNSLALGAVFQAASPSRRLAALKQPLSEGEFNSGVQYGFQATATWHQGSIIDREEGATGKLHSTVGSCKWAFSVEPVCGWGEQGGRQRATAGWLAALPVFEPHWQVMMAHGLASGWIEWGGRRYEFENAPTYAEKNWGGGFPTKWCWIQCNSFAGAPGTSVTAIGAIRGLLQVPGVQEDVGLIGIHHGGRLYELNPRDSELGWEVDPWGRWKIWGNNSRYEALVEATCDSPGTPLRAPTATDGLHPFCRDSFCGQVRVRVWEKGPGGRLSPTPVVDCSSEGCSGAVEVGGGPWWTRWQAKAAMAAPVKAALNLPIDIEALADLLPAQLRPPGL